jgi:hypothetical protein
VRWRARWQQASPTAAETAPDPGARPHPRDSGLGWRGRAGSGQAGGVYCWPPGCTYCCWAGCWPCCCWGC